MNWQKRLSIFFFLLLASYGLYSESHSVFLANPYFLKANEAFLCVGAENLGVQQASLMSYNFALEYGVSENVQLGFNIPYLSLLGAEDGGCFGDVSAFIKLSLAQSEQLSWRIVSAFYFGFPTGVIKEDSYRRVNGLKASYFPFTTGAPFLAPSLIASFLLENFGLRGSVTYFSENSPDENIFYFNFVHDSIDFQLSADYFCSLKIFENSTLSILPIIYLEYKYNLSNMPIIPNGFYFYFQNNLKLDKTWKLTLDFSLPLFAENPVYYYTIAVQIGRYF
jgi:hypothetical protein